MVAVMDREHVVSWMSPVTHWGHLSDTSDVNNLNRLLRPSILRFASDNFMEEIGSLLAYQPEQLIQWEAKYETWEKPMQVPSIAEGLPRLSEPVSRLSTRLTRARIARTGSQLVFTNDSDNNETAPSRKLKLYQPIQQRFYLVAASLVCRRIGFPDRLVDPGKQERVSFVIRRIMLDENQNQPDDNPANWNEHAYVKTDSGHCWQPVKNQLNNSSEFYVDGEERLGLFPVSFTETSGHPRRLHCGLIPVGKREEFVATPKESSDDNEAATSSSFTTDDARLFLFQMQVTAPWRDLVEQVDRQGDSLKVPPPAKFTSEFGSATQDQMNSILSGSSRSQIQAASWYIVLDLERFLFNYINPLWKYLTGSGSLQPDHEELYDWLNSVILDATLAGELAAAGYTVKTRLWQALQAVADDDVRDKLEKVETQYNHTKTRNSNENKDWPGFLFPLADAGSKGPLPFSINGAALSGDALELDYTDTTFDDALNDLINRVKNALSTEVNPVMPELSFPDPNTIQASDAWFTIRYVYERPNCGPRANTVVSTASAPFEMASFFDPEAPARPARIAMPADISLAALRKFKKGTTLAVSDMLCGQLKRIRKLTLGDLVLSVLPWPFHKDLPTVGPTGSCKPDGGNAFGMFCSLSIPIVTLCALILLIIMVSLFNIFFRWIPFLFLCIPIPGLTGKKS